MSQNDEVRLSEADIAGIRHQIQSLRKEKQVLNTIVRDDVFGLLERECKVLYYPVDDLSLWAFHQKVDRMDGTSTGFVFINTAQPYEKQVFAAAHELAHVWRVADNTQEMITEDAVGDPAIRRLNGSDPSSRTEAIANRFAAEFLLDMSIVERLHADVLSTYKGRDDTVVLLALILGLMDACIVPFKMTVRRLSELGLLDLEQADRLLKLPRKGDSSPVIQMQNRLGLCKRNNVVTRIKKFADFVDLIVHDYHQEKISTLKMTQLLALFDLTPEAVGLSVAAGPPPTVDEIEAMLDDEAGENE